MTAQPPTRGRASGPPSVMLLGTELSSTTSGQARFLYNIALGLADLGASVSVVLYGAAGPRGEALERRGIRVVSLGRDPSSRSGMLRRMTRLNDAGTAVAAQTATMDPSDWYVVLSDDLVSAVRAKTSGRWAYLSNGDMALLLLNRTFVAAGRWSRSVVSLGAADLVRSHSKDAEGYDLLLANSEFTRQLMSYLYGLPFQGVVHPPVDPETFRPPPTPPTGDYVLAVARNSAEHGLSLVAALARELPVRVVGGAHVAGATVEGTVADPILAGLYANAAYLAFPTLSEPFGYAVAEALCCGTPALVYDAGGPSELVGKSGGGWVVKTRSEFLARGAEIFRSGVTPEVRRRSFSTSSGLSIAASATALAAYLGLETARSQDPGGASSRADP